MRPLFRDAHHAWRPLFTAIATLTLALEIGASVANFAVVRGVLLLRPLPYHDPARLVQVYDANPARDANMSAFCPQDLDDFSRHRMFSKMSVLMSRGRAKLRIDP
jgi:putative ABC transport system permease protein